MVQEAVVIGAGSAGLSAAAALRDAGVDALVLERAAQAGASWRARYDGLRLNSGRTVSSVPGARIPRSAGQFPARDAYADYLAGCVERLGLDVRFGVEVSRIERRDGGYALSTSGGELLARSVVVATGYDREPCVPKWPGRFQGELLHAREYRNPAPFAGRRVLVVGTGNSGTEIAAELSGRGPGPAPRAARVWLSMRTPVNVVPRRVLGVPTSALVSRPRRPPARLVDLGGRVLQRLAWGDLSRYGMPRAPMGIGTEMRVRGLGPVVDGGFVDALKAGRVALVPAVARFDGAEVVLADDTRVRPDAVIAATGYRHGLEALVGHLGALDSRGRPARVDGGAVPVAPGLHFSGYHLPLPGQLYGMRATARRIAREVARDRAASSGRARARARCRREVATA